MISVSLINPTVEAEKASQLSDTPLADSPSVKVCSGNESPTGKDLEQKNTWHTCTQLEDSIQLDADLREWKDRGERQCILESSLVHVHSQTQQPRCFRLQVVTLRWIILFRVAAASHSCDSKCSAVETSNCLGCSTNIALTTPSSIIIAYRSERMPKPEALLSD